MCSALLLPPRGATLRKGRYSEPGRPYLVTTTVHSRRPVFAHFHLGRLLVRTIRRETVRAETLCYVVMPDHLHWLLVLREGVTLPNVVRNVKSASSNAVLRAGRLEGPLWQKGFHDRALRRDEDVQAVARYVVANPLRAGLVRRVGDYPLWDAVWL